jgi:hypothetical protein
MRQLLYLHSIYDTEEKISKSQRFVEGIKLKDTVGFPDGFEIAK